MPARVLPDPVLPEPAPMVPMAPMTPIAPQFPAAADVYGRPPVPKRRSKAPVVIPVLIMVVALAAAAAWYFLFSNNVPKPSPTTGTTTTQPNTGTGAQTATRLVLPGSCFELSQTQASSPAYGYVWVVPCTDPHDSEVFLNQAVTETTYPGDTAWADLATQYCDPAFKTYVGSDMNTSRLNVQYIRPTSQSWDAGNNQLVCFTVDPSGDRTTSVANSGE